MAGCRGTDASLGMDVLLESAATRGFGAALGSDACLGFDARPVSVSALLQLYCSSTSALLQLYFRAEVEMK